MSKLWPHTHETLDNSLLIYAESLRKLKAAQPVDIEQVAKQLQNAVDAARNLRSLVSSVLPEASWQSREEFDALVLRAHKILEDRARLSALATELGRGSIVHRRAVRVDQLNQLREQAIIELCSHAESQGEPPSLPGPDASQWLEWACGLTEPEDTEALKALRTGFGRLDDFVTELEPGMWVVKTESVV
jgi:hypothetical protein